MKTLHLVLTGHWYDKIASGEKTSEFRAPTEYWNKRLHPLWQYFWDRVPPFENIPTVVFHRGYTNTTMEFQIKDCGTMTGPNDLGLPKVWEIELGKRIYDAI